MGKVIVVTSGKGGVGKTTTVANLGHGLADLGKKVLLVDADIGLRNLDVVLGLESKIQYNLVDVLKGNCRINQALIRDKYNENLFLLPSAQHKSKHEIEVNQMKKLIDELRENFDFIFIDSPAGIDHGFELATVPADCAIVVTTPEISSIRDAGRVIDILNDKEKFIILNQVRNDLVKQGNMLSGKDVAEILAEELLGVIPDDEMVVIATNYGEPLIGSGTMSGDSYERICQRIIGNRIPINDGFHGSGLRARICSFFGR